MVDTDREQNSRIRALEDRVNQIENDVSAILAKLDVVQNLLKAVIGVAGLALGIDIVPMMGGM